MSNVFLLMGVNIGCSLVCLYGIKVNHDEGHRFWMGWGFFGLCVNLFALAVNFVRMLMLLGVM